MVTGVKAGSTKIYCDATDGSYISSVVTVTVLDVKEPVTKIIISGASTVTAGKTIRLSAVVTPASWQEEVVWSSSNNAVGTVTSDGVVKGVTPGTVTITAKAGNKSAAKTISVNAGEVKICDNFKYLDRNGVVKLDVDTTYGRLNYRSSDNAVATVDSQGIITCKGTGRVTVTATNGFVKDDITFTVGNYQSILRLGYKEVDVNAGALVWIEVAGTKADVSNISSTNYNISCGRSNVNFYNCSIEIQASKRGVTYVTVFNSSGYGCTVKVNVLSSMDTKGTRGLSYDGRTSNELFEQINTYRRQKGLKPCRFNQKAENAAKAQIISAHRMAEKNPNYNYALHNYFQLSCYYFGDRNFLSKRLDAEDFLTAWKKSPGHNRALTTADYTDMGVMVYYTPYGYCAFMSIGDPLDMDLICRDGSSTHSHSYKTVVSKATPSRNGKIVKKCSCGATSGTSIIYAPKKMSISASKYTYNGKVRKPSVKVKDSKGRTVSRSNYKVTYSKGRKYVGRYTVKVTFKGNYSGSISKKFDIIPKGTSLSKVSKGRKSLTVKWKKKSSQTSGYQVQCSTNSKFKKGNKTVTIKNNKASIKKITKLKAKKKYYVRVRTYKKVKISGKTVKMYSGWSKAKAVRTR